MRNHARLFYSPNLPTKGKVLLSVIVLAALVLRMSVLNWGLQESPPYSSLNVDEHFSVNVITYFPYLEPTYYGTALPNAIALLIRPPLSLADSIFGTSLQNRYVHAVLFRFINVILGTLVVWLVAFCVFKMTDLRTGILAGILMALAPIHVLNSAIAHVDVFMSLLLLIASMITIWYWRQEKFDLKVYQWLGVIGGLMLGAKITALIVILPLAAILVLIEIGRVGSPVFLRSQLLLRAFFWFSFSLVVAYAALNWNTLFDPASQIALTITTVDSVSKWPQAELQWIVSCSMARILVEVFWCSWLRSAPAIFYSAFGFARPS